MEATGMKTFYLVSLGCAKNLVDSEVMIGSLLADGWQLVDTPEQAGVLVVNTCGFLQSAAKEAIDEIFSLVRVKERYPEKRLVVAGCLVQRYDEKLAQDLPEVDLFVGTEGAERFSDLINSLERQPKVRNIVLPERSLMTSRTPRTITTPFYRAWLKITEGCDNRCSYCMIPSIRGDLRSRTIDDLVLEAQRLEANGVRELSLVAQDSTAYGRDLGVISGLEKLLSQLLRNTSIPWLRVLYLYPTGITEELLDLMASNERIVPYLDLPMQHVNDRVLRAMNRRYDKNQLISLLDLMRRKVPRIAVRTTFLVGFPGETETEFLEVEDFMRSQHLDHVGVFAYSKEEGSASEKLDGHVPAREKNRRVKRLLSLQAELSEKRLKEFVGTVEPVLIEGVSHETELLLQGRTRFQAPEVDGCVFINDGTASVGEIVPVRITESMVYDLVGGIEQYEEEG